MSSKVRFFYLLSLLMLFVVTNSVQGQETVECDDGFWLYDHELLATEPVCIPENPQRVAFIDNLIAYGVALDVDSVTRSYYFDAFLGDFPALVDEEALANMTDVGDTWEMNAEALLVAEPDLVISSVYWTEANEYAQSIAPTVIIDPDLSESWLEVFDAVTQIFGREEQQAELLAQIDERVADLAEVLGEDAADTTFTVTIIESAEQLWTFTNKNFGAELALQAGLSMAETVPTPEETIELSGGPYAVGVSIEELPLIEADHIFLFTNYGDDAHEELFASPIWQSFADIDPDRVHFLEGEYWVRDHPIAAHRVIDDLFINIAGVDPEEVSPNPFAYTYQVEEEETEG